MSTRYIAEWHAGYDGEPGDPEAVVYDTATFQDRMGADAHAKKMSLSEWYRVAEEEFDPDYYGPGASGWRTIRSWVEGVEV